MTQRTLETDLLLVKTPNMDVPHWHLDLSLMKLWVHVGTKMCLLTHRNHEIVHLCLQKWLIAVTGYAAIENEHTWVLLHPFHNRETEVWRSRRTCLRLLSQYIVELAFEPQFLVPVCVVNHSISYLLPPAFSLFRSPCKLPWPEYTDPSS